MADEKLIIGCALPSGILLEVGYTIDPKTGAQIRSKAYAQCMLKGWNAHTESATRAGIQVPAGSNTAPYLNRGVSRSLWEQWKKEHLGCWLLEKEHLFEAKDEASAQVRAIDAEKNPGPFMPLTRDTNANIKTRVDD